MNKVQGVWTIRERDPETGQVVAEKTVENLWTAYGLTALASAIGGSYTPPAYLVIEQNYSQVTGTTAAGSSTIVVTTQIDQTGDTQLIMGVGVGSQETVTFSAVSGTGPYTYTLTAPTINSHTASEYIVRQVNVNDTMTSVIGEVQFDPTNFPSQRSTSPGGYSTGTGNWVTQFYLSGNITQQLFLVCGLADSLAIGSGNLHNHFVLGYNRASSTNDIEIDGSITLTN